MPENQVPSVGSKEEQKLFTELYHHYIMAKEDLDIRRVDFDKKDILFRSHIEEAGWPYKSLVFAPRIFTSLIEKGSRILANKPQGRLIPREGGDSLGAKINNEILSFQWDDNERADGSPMLAKWALMDLNARKYGASFAVVKWHFERKENSIYYDGPNFKPLNNRDVLANPSYSTIKNWCQIREWPTLQELKEINDQARGKPIYKNLDILRRLMQEEGTKGGDTRDSSYVIKDKSIKGLVDYLGKDEVYRTVELITEYRNERWITFAPRHGVILRDIPNPYIHKQIPIVMLKYYPIDDDLYGLSEIEPVEKLQKAVNALICQYLDAINMSLYTPLKIRSTGGAVQMHTLDFGPGAKWLMSDPSSDVIPYEQSATGVAEFTSTYRFLVSEMMEALGETSQGISNLVPGGDKKTATEIKDLALSRSARDNFNQIFLSEALKKQMTFWFKMNQQYFFSSPAEKAKIIRIVGKDAIKYFQSQGLDGEGLQDETIETLSNMKPEEVQGLDLQDFKQPLYPVQVGEMDVPKFNLEQDGQFGSLLVEPDDLSGNYDYVPDIGTMQLPNEEQMIASKKAMVELVLNPAVSQLLAAEQYKIKTKEVLEDYFEQIGMKDADKYFEKLEVNTLAYGANQSGEGSLIPGAEGMVGSGVGGLQANNQTLPNGAPQPVVS